MSPSRQERKVVTVLFCDLVGSTAQAEEMDPEDVAALLTPYHARVKEELERFGGTVEKFIGDAVMAVFGAPVAHEDDPERAVRAALAIREFADDEGIELRVGITTGEALVALDARPEAGETLATGDVVNTAARLQAAAPVNGILVSERTFESTKDVVEYDDAQSIDAKGKAAPVAVWEATAVRTAVGADRQHTSPFVGRTRELALLEGALERTREERQPELVTLVGVPGIGKSRLLHELASGSGDDSVWLSGRCLPYGDGVTFWALGEIVKAHLGIGESDDVEATERKLAAAAADSWVRSRLRPLVGLVDTVAEGDRSEETFAAWRGFVEEIANKGPLVLVVEDLHWADERLLDFVDYLVDWASGVPVLVMCTARPELLERRPGWGGGKTNSTTISLTPLSDDETARLVAQVVEHALPADTEAILLTRAGGNPLYAEQYARMLAERAATDLSLPETVQGIIAARLDGLEPGQKALLQDASVIGTSFWLDALATVSGAESRALETGLHALERKGFIRRERSASMEGATEYAFLHLLVRDVAYGQIPRTPRAEKHAATARWIERLERHEDHAEMLAHHYGEALALTRAAGGKAEELETPVRRALRDAGDRAMALSAYAAARRTYEHALELWPDDDPERPRLLLARARAFFLGGGEGAPELFEVAGRELLARRDREGAAEARTYEAFALWNAGEANPVDVLEVARSAAALLHDARATPVKAYVLANFARYLTLAGHDDEAVEVGRQVLAMADELGLGEVSGNALNTIGLARVSLGDVDGVDDLEESLRLGREHSSPVELSRTYNNLGVMLTHVGRLADALEVFTTRDEMHERLGLPNWFGDAVTANTTYLRGDWDPALRRLDALVAGGFPSGSWPGPLAVRAQIRLARGDAAGAEEDFRRALRALDARWGPKDIDEPCLCAWHALEAGHRDQADELVARVLARVWRPPYGYTGGVYFALLLTDLGRSLEPVLAAAHAHPRLPWLQAAAAVARGDLAAAADRLLAVGSRTVEALVRLRLAHELAAGDRRSEAAEHLKQALAFYRIGRCDAVRSPRRGAPRRDRLALGACPRRAHRRRVSAAPTTSRPIPSTRGQDRATCSTPNQPYRSITAASANCAAIRKAVVATIPIRGPATVIEKTMKTPMTPPRSCHFGPSKASPIPPSDRRTTSRAVSARTPPTTAAVVSASRLPTRSPSLP